MTIERKSSPTQLKRKGLACEFRLHVDTVLYNISLTAQATVHATFFSLWLCVFCI